MTFATSEAFILFNICKTDKWRLHKSSYKIPWDLFQHHFNMAQLYTLMSSWFYETVVFKLCSADCQGCQMQLIDKSITLDMVFYINRGFESLPIIIIYITSPPTQKRPSRSRVSFESHLFRISTELPVTLIEIYANLPPSLDQCQYYDRLQNNLPTHNSWSSAYLIRCNKTSAVDRYH
jgi:hypothetical protein